MSLTNELRKLDEVHSVLVTLSEQGYTSSVLFTIASVLSQVPALDKGGNDPYFWQQVILNLNVLADTLSREELKEDVVFDEIPDDDWDMAEHLLNEEAPFDEDDSSAL